MQWLNPLNWIKILSLIVTIIDGVKAIYKSYKDRKEIQKAKEEIKKTADEAVTEIEKPIDETKTKEQRDKDEEDAFDRLHDKLK